MSKQFQLLCIALYALWNKGASGTPLQRQVSIMEARLSGVERLFGNASALLGDFVDDLTETGAPGDPQPRGDSRSDRQPSALEDGSTMMFHAEPHEIKIGLTQNLSLRCELNYATDSDQIDERNNVKNVDEVLSIVLMQNSKDVAMVSRGQPAKVVDGSSNIETSGLVSGIPGQMCFLTMFIDSPAENQGGDYKCQITTLRSGHATEFSASAKVTTAQPNTADLTALIHDNERKNKQKMDKLRGELDHLKNRTETAIMFFVALTKDVTLSTGQHVRYNKVYTNVGGAYNTTSGKFVCPRDGYYQVAASALASHLGAGSLHVQVNGVPTFSVHGNDHWNGMSNSGILQLNKGDTVGVLAWRNSNLRNSGTEIYATFSGHLLNLI